VLFSKALCWPKSGAVSARPPAFSSLRSASGSRLALAALKRYGAENKVDLPYVKKSVWGQAAIYYAAELGLGQADPQKITLQELKAPRFDEIKSNWA